MGDAGEIVDAVLREVDHGRSAALCAIVATRGSTPQPPGTIVCVDQAAHLTGTLGGGCVEADVRRRAHELLSAGRSALLTFALDHDFGYDDGMICGGQMDVAVSVLSPSMGTAAWVEARRRLRIGEAATLPLHIDGAAGPVEYRVHLEAAPELVIAGAGHISRVLAGMMLPLGFRVHVVDDRAESVQAGRFPQPIQTVCGDIASALGSWAFGPNAYVVIVTRGHRHDEEALRTVLRAPVRYIGMIGSRRKVKVIFDDLRHGGATEAQLNRIHAPIGVDIGAVTTEEIAVSIAAELVAHRRAKRRVAVEGPIPVTGETA